MGTEVSYAKKEALEVDTASMVAMYVDQTHRSQYIPIPMSNMLITGIYGSIL